MLLLHLSDLHFGNKNRFASDKPADLGNAFYRAMKHAYKDCDMPDSEIVSLVIVTGDFVESGLPSEFMAAHEFLASLAGEMKLLHERFVFLPGNHDISWAACRKTRSACKDEEFPAAELEVHLQAAKLKNYRDFVSKFYGKPITADSLAGLANSSTLGCDGWLRNFPDLRLSVAALNTSERENDELKGGFLSSEQAQKLMSLWTEESTASLLKILTLHHNPVATTAANRDWTLDWLREKEKEKGAPVSMSHDVFAHYLADLAGFSGGEHLYKIVNDTETHLVLHGHHHDQGNPTSWHWQKDGSAPVLSVGSFGLSENQLPGNAPLSCQFLRFLLPPEFATARLQAIPLVYDGRFRLKGQVLEGAFRREERSRAAYDQPLPLSVGWVVGSTPTPTVENARKDARGPEEISIARLPATGSDVFGREEDIAFLDRAWANQQVNVVTIVAWAGVGKSTLVNHWLRRMAAEDYRSAKLVFGWSFDRQSTTGDASSADEFLDAALAWFGDPDPRLGTAWEKGERPAKLIARRRTLLVLDGLEPLQNPPGPQEGRLRDASLRALLRELAAFNQGLCVITTRIPVADIADHERTSAPRRDLEHLSSDAGAKLLRALGVKGREAELRSASNELSGHCLALTLLGSYLTDVCNGDIHRRKEVHFGDDERQGGYAQQVMASYQTSFGESPELSVLLMLGLFDRPADEKAFETLLQPPAIPGLSESLTNLSPNKWQTVLSKIRRARLLADNPRHLDTHPLVREYFGEQLRKQRPAAWRECNRRLYKYYLELAPKPRWDRFREMEPLFLAVICGCKAGLLRDALREVYIPRIQRGEGVAFAAKILGAYGALLSVLAHFFEHGRWGSIAQTEVEGQGLSEEDQLFVLLQAGLYLTATLGMGAPEARSCYERAEPLCRSLNHPLRLYDVLMNEWRSSLIAEKLSETMRIAEQVHSLAREQKDAALMVGAYRTLAVTFYYLGDFGSARRNSMDGVQIWRAGEAPSPVEEVHAPAVLCLCCEALCEWHFGELTSCQATMADATSLAQKMEDMYAVAVALWYAAVLGHFERDSVLVERLASDLIERATHQNIAYWLHGGEVFRGWARSASGDPTQGIALIEEGIRALRTAGSMLMVPYWLALKAEALHLADRTPEALEAIGQAEALVEKTEEMWWCSELHRLRGVFLATLGAGATEIEASFDAAIETAKKQKSTSLVKRAEATHAEYRSQKRALGRHGFRLPLC